MPLAGSTLLLRENCFPACIVGFLDGFLFGLAGDEGAFDGDFRGVVAVEVRRVDFDAGDAAGGDAEADDDPVEGLGVVTPRFPAVVPGACVDEVAGFADWGCGCDEVGGAGEPFVAEGEDGGTKRCRYKI